MTVTQSIDCDIHPAMPTTKLLLPFLDEYWANQIVVRGIDGLNLASYAPRLPLTARPDWRHGDAIPGSRLETIRRDALDGFGSSLAILNCLHGAQATFSEDLAAALCKAINDWLVVEWLDKEPRLRASILVPMQSPELAVEEIERRAKDHRFVQVLLLAGGDEPLGKRRFWPIYAAAEKHGLAIGIHAGSQNRIPSTSIGWTSYRFENYVAQSQVFQAQLLSFVMQGVFSKFPKLTLVLIESGVTWLPATMWRAIKIWRAMRMEVPWVNRSPADIVREHVRLTVQPFDCSGDPQEVERTIAHIGSQDMFLFASDYPHWQFDGDDPMPKGFSPELARRIRVDNPLATYPRLKELVS